MRYFALACDYDGTLAPGGRADPSALEALRRVRESGRKLILVTGRELPDLASNFPHLDLFDRVVAENGALLYRPASREELLLAEPPPRDFVDLLRQRGVAPLSTGRVVIATWRPKESIVLDAIRHRGLEFQVIFNKEAVMVLPPGVNKATGLRSALEELGLSTHNVVGIGDAENDHAFLEICECSAAVSTALASVKERADLVTRGGEGAGVAELAWRILENDLADVAPPRLDLMLGSGEDGTEVRVRPYGENLLVAGTSGGGKSTLATGFLERLLKSRYQFCIIDPEGDYQTFQGAVVLGEPKRAPTVKEVIQLLEKPGGNAAVNLLGLPLEQRPAFFDGLFASLLELRARTGRPHWIVIDETHHLLPTTWAPAGMTIPQALKGMVFITVHPEHVSPSVLSLVDMVVAIGKDPKQTIGMFSRTLGEPPPDVPTGDLVPGEAFAWRRSPSALAIRFRTIPPVTLHQRHRRKYADGELPPDRSFYFRGPEGKLNLRAQNLNLFLQLAEGVDDATWMHHLRLRDYSRWFREGIKDPDLAGAASEVENRKEITPAESRRLIRERIQERYTQAA